MPRLKVLLGTGDFARRGFSEEKVCHDALDLFFSRGGREIDTAHMYSGGDSEKVIGRYMSASANAPQLSVHTKINPWAGNTLKKECVLKQAATSLSRLQTSCVDVLYLHAPDHNTPIEETLEAVQQLYTEGKFKEFGVCNYASWEVADIYHICKSRGWILPTVYQGMYNPITRSVESELLPALRRFGMRFYAYNPTAMGLLSGKYSYSDFENLKEEVKEDSKFFKSGKWSEVYQDRYWREPVFRGVELVKKALNECYGEGQVGLLNATFRWFNHHSQLSPEHNDGVVLGGSCLKHVSQNMSCCEEGPLDERVVKAFDEAWELDKRDTANYFR